MSRYTMRNLTSVALLGAVLVFAPTTSAQGDPQQEIKEIAERIDKQLKEVDRLLLESSSKQGGRSAPKQLLEQSMEHSAEAVEGIEQLIEKLNEMKNSSSSSSSSSSSDQQQQGQQSQDQQQQQQQQQQQGGQQNRRENNTPEFAQQDKPGEQQGQQGEQQQPGQKPGEKPGEQQQPGSDGQPQGGREKLTPGENRQGNQPPEGQTGEGSKASGSESWGELQPYLNSLKNRGATPKVPPKYRKYWEAYLKNKRATGKAGGGR